MSPSASARPPPPRWPLFLSVRAGGAAGVGWTGLWFYAAARAEAEMAAWRERERQAGRPQDCASQSIGGYPFRIEVRCGGASLRAQGHARRCSSSFHSLLVAVQVYDPKLLISEFTGPLEISEPGRPPAAIVNWNLGQASVRGLPSDVERASLVLVLRPSAIPAPPTAALSCSAQRLELHGRRAAGSTPDNPLIETVLRLNAAVADKLHPLAAKPIDADIAAVLRGVIDISPKPWAVRFKEWQARDGRIEIHQGAAWRRRT